VTKEVPTIPVALSESRKELLGKILRGTVAADSRPQGIVRRSLSEAPVSYGQQQIWLHSQVSAPTPIYNEMVTIRYAGRLDRAAFEKAFSEVIRRHEAWRTTFVWRGAELVQCIQPPPGHIEIPCIDVSTLPADTREQTALQAVKKVALDPYDLAVGPMYRPRLVTYSEEDHRLYLGLHHIIFDGVSLYGVLMPELQMLYEAFSNGRPSPLAQLSLQYPDYAGWHREWVKSIAPQQLEYWRSKLQGMHDRETLPTDHPRQEAQSYRGATELLALSIEKSNGLKDLSQRQGTTLFMTLLASFYALLWVYTGEDDIIAGCTSSGRSRSETESMLGFFLNTIALRINLSGDPSFLTVMERAKDELLSSLDNDGIPFEFLVEKLCEQMGRTKHPFFQTLFAFQPPLAALEPNWKFSQMDIDLGVTKFDLHLELDERPEGIIGRFMYNADLFDRGTIQEMVGVWQAIVAKVVTDASVPLSQLVPDLKRRRGVRRQPASEPGSQVLKVAKRSEGWNKSIRRIFRRDDSAGGAA
jgi:surfactin family lipopeptide synthetase A